VPDGENEEMKIESGVKEKVEMPVSDTMLKLHPNAAGYTLDE